MTHNDMVKKVEALEKHVEEIDNTLFHFWNAIKKFAEHIDAAEKAEKPKIITGGK
jgi:hypothetical protein